MQLEEVKVGEHVTATWGDSGGVAEAGGDGGWPQGDGERGSPGHVSGGRTRERSERVGTDVRAKGQT